MFGTRNLSDVDLLCVATATALPLSPSSSLVHNLTTQFSTTNIGSPMDTTTTIVTSNPIRTSGPHIPVKLLTFDPKQPKRWFQQTEAIFRRSHVVSSQDKWDYVLPKLPTDVLNDISDEVDSLMDDTPNPYDLVKNCLLETYTPTQWQLARQLLNFPHISGVRPTTLMNQLLSLLPPGDHPETMFLMLFLDRLPPNISGQLTALPSQSRSSSLVSTVSMRSVFRSGCRRSRSPALGHRPDYCYYHRRFGVAAHHSQAPCSWLGSGVGNGPAAGGL